MSTQTDIETLHTWINKCKPGDMVFFGGAGVSTESGIPDFRSADGIFMKSVGRNLAPEQVVSRSFFDLSPKEFYDVYCTKMVFRDAKPNPAHLKLAELEQRGILRSVITQNIDGLHQMAGCRNVWELHGSIHRNYCMDCHRYYGLDEMLQQREQSSDGIPHCDCGGIIKPDVVLYEESLDEAVLEQSVYDIQHARLMVVAGTSLVVNPAASLVRYFQGDHLVIVNLSPTYADSIADLCINEKIGKVFNFTMLRWGCSCGAVFPSVDISGVDAPGVLVPEDL